LAATKKSENTNNWRDYDCRVFFICCCWHVSQYYHFGKQYYLVDHRSILQAMIYAQRNSCVGAYTQETHRSGRNIVAYNKKKEEESQMPIHSAMEFWRAVSVVWSFAHHESQKS